MERRNLKNILFTEGQHIRGWWDDDQQEAITKWQRQFRLKWLASMDHDKGIDIGNRQRIDETGGSRWSKICFYMWIKLVKSSGVRSTELRQFSIGTVQPFFDGNTGRTYTQLLITRKMSKTNRTREVICNDVDTIYNYWQDFKYEWERKFGVPPDDDAWAFPMVSDPHGPKPMGITQSFFRHIRRLDNECGLVVSETRNKFDQRRRTISLYSIRKLYISKCLENPKLTPFIVAENAGTSLSQIKSAYMIDINKKHRDLFCAAVLHIRELNAEADQEGSSE